MSTGNIISISLNQTLLWKVRNFPSNSYNFEPGDNLTDLMLILLGNAGTQQLTNVQTAARITQEILQYSDLDTIMGTMLNSPRFPSEAYLTNINPFTDQLSPNTWDLVQSNDAAYRERLIGTATAYLRGATPIGLQMLAEATSGIKFRAIEVWNTVLSGTTISGTNIQTRGFGNNETVMLPLVPSDLGFTNLQRIETLKSTENLKTTGLVVSVASGLNPFVQLPYQFTGNNNFTTSGKVTIVSGNSQYFTLHRQVTGNSIDIPSYVSSSTDQSIVGRYWLRNNQTTIAPYFSHLETQESLTDVTQNITSALVTPISTIGQISPYTIDAPVGKPTLAITSTIYGAQ